jgi:hypothetical protein
MNNVERGQELALAVGEFLASQGIGASPEYSVMIGSGSKSTKMHRFDFGSPNALVECKCYGWIEGGNNPSAKISTLNEAMMFFYSVPPTFRKMLFLPKTSKKGARSPETLAEYYVRLHDHFIPATAEIWELDPVTKTARKV